MDSISSASSRSSGRIRGTDMDFSPVRLWTPISPHPPPTCEPSAGSWSPSGRRALFPGLGWRRQGYWVFPHPPGNKDVSWVRYPLCSSAGMGGVGTTPLTPTWLPSCPHLNHSLHHHMSRLHPRLPGQTRPVSCSHSGVLFPSHDTKGPSDHLQTEVWTTVLFWEEKGLRQCVL